MLLTLILKRFVGAVLSRDWEEEWEGKKSANFNTDNTAAEKLQFFLLITDVFLLGNSPCDSVLFAMFHPHFPSTKRAAVNLLEQHITAHTGWGGWTRAAYEEIKL